MDFLDDVVISAARNATNHLMESVQNNKPARDAFSAVILGMAAYALLNEDKHFRKNKNSYNMDTDDFNLKIKPEKDKFSYSVESPLSQKTIHDEIHTSHLASLIAKAICNYYSKN